MVHVLYYLLRGYETLSLSHQTTNDHRLHGDERSIYRECTEYHSLFESRGTDSNLILLEMERPNLAEIYKERLVILNLLFCIIIPVFLCQRRPKVNEFNSAIIWPRELLQSSRSCYLV